MALSGTYSKADMEERVHDESVARAVRKTEIVMWVNTIANVVGTVVLIIIALTR